MASTHQNGSPRKVILVEVATGKRHERWPVDAREMLRQKKDDQPVYTLAEGESFTPDVKDAVKTQVPLVPRANPRAAPQAGKVTLYHKETGESIERWPVDAREILKAKDSKYTTEKPGTEQAQVVADGNTPEELLEQFREQARKEGYREDAVEAIAKDRFARHFAGEPQVINPVLAKAAVNDGTLGEYAPGVPLVVAKSGTDAVGSAKPMSVTRSG